MNVLFMQSQTYFGADSQIHALLMRHLCLERVSVFAACNRGDAETPSASYAALSTVPDLHLRPTYFGPSTHFLPRRVAVLRAIMGALPTAWSLASLVGYARDPTASTSSTARKNLATPSTACSSLAPRVPVSSSTFT